MAENIVEVNDNNFNENVIEKSKKIPVIVDFWAEWCGPCQMLGPILDKIAGEYKDKVIFVKLNVGENQEKSQEYDIMSIPAIKMFKNGKVVDGFVGAIPESQIKDWIDENL